MAKTDNTAKIFLGLVIFLGGAIALLDRTGLLVLPFYHQIFTWKIIFILVGIYKLIKEEFVSAIVLLSLGSFFYLRTHLPDFRVFFWPLIAMLAGLVLMVKSGSSKKKSKDFKDNKKGVLSDRLEEVAVFGGNNKVVSSQNFEGGEIVAVFGGNEVDLRPANVVEGGAELEVVCVFGGTEIKIPEDWDVEVSATSIFGAVKDERRVVGDLDSTKKIVLTGAVVFGGVVIKN